VRYIDKATGLDHTVRRIDFTARDVSLETEVQFQLRAAMLGDEVDLEISGTAGPVGGMPVEPAGVPLAATAEFGPLETARLMALAAAAGTPVELPEETTIAGAFSGEATVDGTVGALQTECNVDLTGLTVVMGEFFQKGDDATAGIDLKGTVSADAMDFPGVECRLGEVAVWVDAHLGDQPRFGIRADGIDVVKLAPFVPMVGEYGARGTLSLNAHIAPGLPDHPVADGTVTLKGGAARVPQLPSEITDATARITFETTSFSVEEASFRVGQSSLSAGVVAKQLEPFDATFSVRAPVVHRTDFQAPAPGQKPLPRPEVLRDVAVDGRLRGSGEDVRHTARVTSASGVLSNIDYTGLSASIEGDKDVITITSYRASALDGTLSGDGRFLVTATPPAFELNTRVENVNLAEYFRYKYEKLPKVIEGRASLNVGVDGQGESWEAIQPTLNGKGDALVIKGALLNMNIARDFIDGVQSDPRLSSFVPAGFSQRLYAKYPQVFEGDKTIFDNMKGSLAIEQGRVHTRDLSLATRSFDLRGAGWVGFDQQMDFKTTLHITKALTDDIISEVPEAKYALDAHGRIEIPLKVSGMTTRPRLELDYNAMWDRIQDNLLKDGGNQLKGIWDKLRKGGKD
jgi:autotransporter translocation and assembly factor TamB